METPTPTGPTDSGAIVAILHATGRPVDEFTTFMGALVEQSRQDYASTTSRLIDSLALECAESAALLQLIGEAVHELAELPYAPSVNRIMMCMYPTAEALRERTLSILAARGVHSRAGDYGDDY